MRGAVNIELVLVCRVADIGELRENSYFRPLVGCIDKGVKSKSDIATPQNLLSGPIENTWKKNQRSRFRKTPGTGQKTILTPPGPPK